MYYVVYSNINNDGDVFDKYVTNKTHDVMDFCFLLDTPFLVLLFDDDLTSLDVTAAIRERLIYECQEN